MQLVNHLAAEIMRTMKRILNKFSQFVVACECRQRSILKSELYNQSSSTAAKG
jgi:hypothetical protein